MPTHGQTGFLLPPDLVEDLRGVAAAHLQRHLHLAMRKTFCRCRLSGENMKIEMSLWLSFGWISLVDCELQPNQESPSMFYHCNQKGHLWSWWFP